MPIQPLAPTFRLNSGEKDDCFLSPGRKVPFSCSSRKKARTSRRSSSASGGRLTGSNWKL
jgi:hypothetical protein